MSKIWRCGINRFGALAALVTVSTACSSMSIDNGPRVSSDDERVRRAPLQDDPIEPREHAINNSSETSNVSTLGGVAKCPVLMAGMEQGQSSDATLVADDKTISPLWEREFQGEHFNQVWGSDEADIWALGRSDPPTHAQEALAAYECEPSRHDAELIARHYDGEEFREVEFPGNSSVNDLHGSAADDVWAVGANGMAWHFDGDAWKSFDLTTAIDFDAGNDPCSDVMLTSVWSQGADDAWIVGFVHTPGTVKSLLLHFDGDGWTQQSVPGDEPLLGVWAADAEHVWAVGARGAVYTLDGDTWRRVPTMTERDLTAVSGGSQNNVWVAGNSATMLRFDGKDWKSSAAAGDYTLSQAMTARAGAGVWMLNGTVTEKDLNLAYVQTLDHWDGETWCSLRSTKDTARMLTEIWVSPRGQVWAAGYALMRLL